MVGIVDSGADTTCLSLRPSLWCNANEKLNGRDDDGNGYVDDLHGWNFLGTALMGWGCVLLGGCPLRQLVLTGEGNSDSAVTVLGMIAGAAVSHNFNLASGPSVLAEDGTVTGGSTENGHIAVLVILAVLVVVSVLCTFVKKKEQKNG